MTFAAFMASPAGRFLRAIVGLALIGGGVLEAAFANNTILGIVLVVVGLLPLLAGLFDFCVVAPLFGAPLSGAKVRASQHSHAQ